MAPSPRGVAIRSTQRRRIRSVSAAAHAPPSQGLSHRRFSFLGLPRRLVSGRLFVPVVAALGHAAACIVAMLRRLRMLDIRLLLITFLAHCVPP